MFLFEHDEGVHRLRICHKVVRLAARLTQVPIVHLPAREMGIKVPSNNRTIDTTCEDEFVRQVETATHDIMVMDVGRDNSGQITTASEVGVLLICLALLSQRGILPNMQLLIPTDG